MIDSHIHLSCGCFDQTFPYISQDENGYTIDRGDRAALTGRMKDAGITGVIEPAIDVASNKLLLDLAAEYPGFVFPAVGNHPTGSVHSRPGDFRRVREYAADKRVIAIGETGLDYHSERKAQHRFRQKIWFNWQIRLADELKLPLILHIRMAHEDAIRILRSNKRRLHGGVCHCFVGSPSEARIYTEELGLCLGIGGCLLMKPKISRAICEAVRETPLEYLLLETDGPFVKPVKPENISKKQWQTARNTSLILPAVASVIAEIKGITAEEVLRKTEENTKRVFRIRR